MWVKIGFLENWISGPVPLGPNQAQFRPETGPGPGFGYRVYWIAYIHILSYIYKRICILSADISCAERGDDDGGGGGKLIALAGSFWALCSLVPATLSLLLPLLYSIISFSSPRISSFQQYCHSLSPPFHSTFLFTFLCSHSLYLVKFC